MLGKKKFDDKSRQLSAKVELDKMGIHTQAYNVTGTLGRKHLFQRPTLLQF